LQIVAAGRRDSGIDPLRPRPEGFRDDSLYRNWSIERIGMQVRFQISTGVHHFQEARYWFFILSYNDAVTWGVLRREVRAM
jgi:hypothetical protein